MFNYPFQAYEKRILKDFVCEDKIEMNLQKYIVSGVILINSWSDHKGSYAMDSFEIDANSVNSKEEFIEVVKKNLNDGGFGAKDLLGAYVTIQAVYDHPIMMGFAKFEVGEEFISCDGYELSDDDREFLFETISVI